VDNFLLLRFVAASMVIYTHTMHRSDLARRVYAALDGEVGTVFDDTIISLASGARQTLQTSHCNA